MIWAIDVNGRLQYTSPEWTRLTGQSRSVAKNDGWLSAIHPDDRATVANAVNKAVGAAVAFSVGFRLRTEPKAYIWVFSGAEPAFAPDGSFIGFLGAISEILDEVPEVSWSVIGEFRALPAGPATKPTLALDIIADYLLLAHSLALQIGAQSLSQALHPALLDLATRIANAQRH
jgi:PAS domain S-box-containing protein